MAKAPITYTDLKVNDEVSPRLADALARYDVLKDAMDESKAEYDKAKAAYDEVREVILAETHAGDRRIAAWRLHFFGLDRPLEMRWQTQRYFDDESLRAEDPDLAERYTKVRGYWLLKRKA